MNKFQDKVDMNNQHLTSKACVFNIVLKMILCLVHYLATSFVIFNYMKLEFFVAKKRFGL